MRMLRQGYISQDTKEAQEIEPYVFHGSFPVAVIGNEAVGIKQGCENILHTIKPADYDAIISTLEGIVDMAHNYTAEEMLAYVGYNPVFGDFRIILSDGKKILSRYTYGSKIKLDDSIDLFNICIHQDHIKIPMHIERDTTYEAIFLNTTIEKKSSEAAWFFVHPALGAKIIKAISTKFNTKSREVEDIMLSEKDKVSPKTLQHSLKIIKERGEKIVIKINHTSVEFHSPDKDYNFLDAVLKCSRNLSRKAKKEDVYEKIFERDYYVTDKEQRGIDNDLLYYRWYNTNKKIKANAGVKENLILSEKSHYYLNPKFAKI